MTAEITKAIEALEVTVYNLAQTNAGGTNWYSETQQALAGLKDLKSKVPDGLEEALGACEFDHTRCGAGEKYFYNHEEIVDKTATLMSEACKDE